MIKQKKYLVTLSLLAIYSVYKKKRNLRKLISILLKQPIVVV